MAPQREVWRAPAISMRVYINTPSFHVRPFNTDWQYTRILGRLPEFVEALEIYHQEAWWNAARYNLSHLLTTSSQRLRLPLPSSWLLGVESKLSRRDLIRSKCDLVFSYGHFPTNASPVPVVFHTGATNGEELRRRGISEAKIERERSLKRRAAQDAALVTVNSSEAAANLSEFMPESVSKIRTVPFFLPHLEAVDDSSVIEKFREPELLRLVFVGREARRKGLPAVLEAFTKLNREMPGRLHLSVVSNFADGPVTLPDLPNLAWIPTVPREQVTQMLRRAHFLLMPSRYESYGWVYLEAMAAGAIPLASDSPIQREILADGACGLLVVPLAESIVEKLLPLLRNPEGMQSMARAALGRCTEVYLPHAVARRMRETFEEALQRKIS